MNTPPFKEMQRKPWFVAYLGFVAVATVAFGIHNFRDEDSWCMGDWLINYRAGFVRRGLPGEVALRIAHGPHLSPFLVVLLMQLACYAAMFYSVHRLVSGIRLQLWTAVALLSPATLAFQILAPSGGFRKEIILLGGLGILILLLLRWPRQNALLIAYVSLLSVICVLSHESLIVFSVYIVAALAIGLASISQAIKLSILPAVFAVSAFVLVSHHTGNAQMARQICSAVGFPATGSLPAPCGGAINALGQNLSFAREQVLLYFRVAHYDHTYPILAALAFLPFAMAYKKLWRHIYIRSSLAVLAIAALISFIASSPLFYYATDWGRWIYIHVFCIFLLLLQIEYLRQNNPPAKEMAITPEMSVTSTTRPKFQRAAAIAFLVLYATCWELPYVGIWDKSSPYIHIVSAMFKP